MKFKIKIILPLIMNIRMYIIALLLSNLNCFAGNDFMHTLALAKHSSCSYIAAKFDALSRFDGFGNFVLKELKKKEKGLFPWRFEITNGYQEGFVYYALLGYANELSGDIPFAYRCYQNSLACIDEDKSFDFPLPRAEIYLAIGRTCLAAGRYMDAKDWLDNAFLEAGDNLQLQAAIDRVGIQRANEIGDYPEIIFLYQHLLSIANDNNSPPLKVSDPANAGGDTGGFKNTDGVVELTKDEIANYAQILFYSRKDREGFSKLLTGISKLGIDNNLGVKDPLVDKFLNNIMRADDDEVKWFYDLLGWAIVDARAKAGDEEYLAFLCNARTLFCKVYDFLDSEDDLKKVKERIDIVKEQIAQGYDVFGDEKKYSVSGNRYSVKKNRKIIKASNLKIINGEMERSPEVVTDDLLMLADWKLKQRDYKTANTNYYLASLIATGKFANLEYDGTTMKNVAVMGGLMINPKSQIGNSKFFDGSYRAAETTLKLYFSATNDEQCAEYDTEAVMNILPIANPKLLRYLIRKQRWLFKSNHYDEALKTANEYCRRKNESNIDRDGFYIFKDIIEDNYNKSFERVIKLMTVNPLALNYFEVVMLFPDSNRLLEYKKEISPYFIPIILQNREETYNLLKKIFEKINMSITIKKLLNEGKEKEALSLLTVVSKPDAWGNIKKGNIYLKSGETNIAYECGLKAFRQKCRSYEYFAHIEPIIASTEITKLINLQSENNFKKASDEQIWYKKREAAITNNQKEIFLFLNKQFIKSKYLPE